MNMVAPITAEERARLVEAHAAQARGSTYALTIRAVSRGLFAHGDPRTVYLRALQRGLEATYEHDGRWLIRNHVIRAEGDPVQVTIWSLAAVRTLNRGAEMPVATTRKETR